MKRAANANGIYSVVTDKYHQKGLTHRQAMNLGQHIKGKGATVAVLKHDDVVWSYVTPTPFENV